MECPTEAMPPGAAETRLPGGRGLPKLLGAQPLPQDAQGARRGALGFDVCLAGFQTGFGPIPPFYFSVSAFWNGNVYPKPVS